MHRPMRTTRCSIERCVKCLFGVGDDSTALGGHIFSERPFLSYLYGGRIVTSTGSMSHGPYHDPLPSTGNIIGFSAHILKTPVHALVPALDTANGVQPKRDIRFGGQFCLIFFDETMEG